MTTPEKKSPKLSRDPGLAPVDPVETPASPMSEEQEVEDSAVKDTADVSRRKKEIESFNLSSAPVVSIPTYTNKINLNEMGFGKLKKEKDPNSGKRMNEIPFFYFSKDGQRCIFTPPEVAGMAETCLITSTWFNILEIFQIKPLLCTTSIQNSTKVIQSDIHKQMIKALPYAAWQMGREGVEDSKKPSVRQCILVLEHFLLVRNGERYNRKHTRYRSVNSNFLANFIDKKECSEYQKTMLMSIRTVLLEELKNSPIDKDTVVDYKCEIWNGALPRRIKETYTKQEQQAIAVISAKLPTGSIDIDRGASIADQTKKVEEHIKTGVNKNAEFKEQIINTGKERRKAISGYFPVQNPKNMKKSKFADLYESYKGDSNNLEALNPLQLVPAGKNFTITALSVPMNHNDDAYNDVRDQINEQIQSQQIAAVIMSIYMKEKDIFKTLTSNRR